jgi:serine/threonine protein kinase/tetratricopeptide (TPR) repeat protein
MRVCPYCHLLLADNESVCPHDATQTTPVEASPVPGALQSKYRDLQPFAQGQTGVLYLGQQTQSAFKGLLKVIPLARFEGSERVRLKRELRKQTKLAHDGLPRIVDGGELPQELWLFREFVAGESLAQRIRRRGRLEVDEALLITAQVASALDELQRNGLLHRDVKPGHVILESSPKNMPISKLIDAGVAARLPGESVFDLVGTPAYISPEQVSGKLVSFRSDLYALGCMLFEMLTGKPPFPSDNVKAVLDAHKNAKVPDPDVALPAPALALLRALLAKEPRQRPFSAQQVRRTLEPLLPPGAPLPVLQSRAPSSAGGISAPPPAAGRGSSPGAKPRSSVPPTPPAAARANRDRSGGIPTEEISLEEIELPPSQVPNTILLQPDDLEEIDGRGPSTIRLGEDDIAALEVREEAAALSAAVAREPEELAYDTGQVAAISAAASAATHAEPEPAPAPTVQEFNEPAAGVVQESASPVAAEPAPASGSGTTGRRAVDFDVESLFDDDVPSEPAVRAQPELQDAPTQIYRPRSDAPPPARAEAPYIEPAADRPDPEGTVMVPRPGAKPPARRTPWLWIGAGAGVLLLLVLVFAGGDDGEAPAAAAGDGAPAAVEGDGKKAAAPASPAALPAPQADRAQARAQREPVLPATEQPGAAAADEAPSAAVAPTPEQLAVMREGSEQEQPAQAQPAAAAPSAPAAAAAADPVQPAAAAAAGEQRRTGEPTLSAAAASAKLGPSAGSKLVAPRAPRADRVAKAAEFKQQGRDFWKNGRYREAAAAYQSATEQDPSDAGAFAGLGAARLEAGDANASIAAYSRAVRLQPGSSGFHAALGRAYLASGDRIRARAAYQKALELNPNNGAAKTALAQLR